MEVLAVPEVHKDALSCLRPEVANAVASGPNGCSEHQVEGEGFGDVVAGVRSLDFILCELIAQLARAQLIEATQHVPDCLSKQKKLLLPGSVNFCNRLPR